MTSTCSLEKKCPSTISMHLYLYDVFEVKIRLLMLTCPISPDERRKRTKVVIRTLQLEQINLLGVFYLFSTCHRGWMYYIFRAQYTLMRKFSLFVKSSSNVATIATQNYTSRVHRAEHSMGNSKFLGRFREPWSRLSSRPLVEMSNQRKCYPWNALSHPHNSLHTERVDQKARVLWADNNECGHNGCYCTMMRYVRLFVDALNNCLLSACVGR